MELASSFLADHAVSSIGLGVVSWNDEKNLVSANESVGFWLAHNMKETERRKGKSHFDSRPCEREIGRQGKYSKALLLLSSWSCSKFACYEWHSKWLIYSQKTKDWKWNGIIISRKISLRKVDPFLHVHRKIFLDIISKTCATRWVQILFSLLARWEGKDCGVNSWVSSEFTLKLNDIKR